MAVTFQSTLPRGERPQRGQQASQRCYFNPRSRVGSDRGPKQSKVTEAISIHAPAWGATADKRTMETKLIISIHAPAWGATPLDEPPLKFKHISIHAPAWGATCAEGRTIHRRNISIHAPAWGATVSARASNARLPFQSTLPRGERLQM